MTRPSLLIGDLGGTSARFALADPQQGLLHDIHQLPCADYASAADAIAEYLAQVRLSVPTALCLAVAGPISKTTGNNPSGQAGASAVQMTNSQWHLDAAALGERLGTDQVRLVNDFEAVAYALPGLGAADRRAVGVFNEVPVMGGDYTLAVLGPGTGLGIAGLLRRDGVIHPVAGEGGHRGFAPESARQLEVLERLRERFERVSAERILSGPGLVNLYRALQPAQGETLGDADAAVIFSRAQAAQDRTAVEAVALFFEILGQLAGDVALEFGANDGVYIAGGIAPRYPKLLEASGFRAAFERKGRYRDLLRKVPTWLITHPYPGLAGAAALARRWFAHA